jgi:carboxymethylenebutenolidase
VAEKTIRIDTGDGRCTTFIAHPDGEGPFPVVMFYMDASGIREELRDMARRIAGHGYYTVLPDFYYRFGDNVSFDPAKLSPGSEEMNRMFATMGKLSDDMVIADTQAILHHVAGDAAAASGPRGCVGFCMGGRHVLRVMSALPDEYAAGAGLHPSFLVTDAPDSPHLGAATIRGELYLSYGEVDQIAPASNVPVLTEQFESAGVKAEFDVHAACDHGFMFPGHHAYNEGAAERSWERTLDLFGRNLHGVAAAAG